MDEIQIPSPEFKVEGYTNPVLALGAILRGLSRDMGVPLADDFEERIERYADWCDQRIDESFDAGTSVPETLNNLCRASDTGLWVVFKGGEIGIV